MKKINVSKESFKDFFVNPTIDISNCWIFASRGLVKALKESFNEIEDVVTMNYDLFVWYNDPEWKDAGLQVAISREGFLWLTVRYATIGEYNSINFRCNDPEEIILLRLEGEEEE